MTADLDLVQLAAIDAGAADGFDAHEQVALVRHAGTGLHAIVAIHSTHLGPAAGGVRRWAYGSEAEALTDALRLSRGGACGETPMAVGR